MTWASRAITGALAAGSLVVGLAPAGTAAPAQAPAEAPPPRSAPAAAVDPATVVVEADGAAAEEAATRAGLRYEREVTPGFHALRAPGPGPADTKRVAGRGVRQAFHPSRFTTALAPSDPLTPAQNHLSQVNAPAAWDVSQGSTEVRIAVVDTGIADHPDLPTITPANRATFLTHPPEAYDQPPCTSGRTPAFHSAHATHVAGIATARGGEHPAQRGGTGVVWRSTLLDARVLNVCGDGYGDDIAAGITWAADNGAHVVNLSLSGSGDIAVLAAIQYARSRGAVVVAAAGNAPCGSAGLTFPLFPASFPVVLAVGSTDIAPGDPTSCFSVRGGQVDLGAPGRQVLSTFPAGLGPGEYAEGVPLEPDGSGYGYLSGTSMATPVVAGAAALLFAAVPGITSTEVEARLLRSSTPTTSTCKDLVAGRLDVGAAAADAVNIVGYRMVEADGLLQAFGGECRFGDAFYDGIKLVKPIVGMASTPSKAGYWLVAGDGGIFGWGDAPFYGSTGGLSLSRPVVGMAANPTGRGYWLVASDGGVFAYGDAPFLGSTGGLPLNQPIVGMAPTPTGRGYWLVAADGGIFAYGDARFLGSTGGSTLNRPVRGLQPTRTGAGYWMVGSDGGIFAFGDAPFLGSTGGLTLNKPVVAMVAPPNGVGYWLVAADGGVFAYGDAPFLGADASPDRSFVAASG